MTEEEKAALAAKDALAVEPIVEIDPIAEKDAKIAKLEEERDNYKAVALKRLGKLPGDAEFLAGNDGDKELSVAEQVRLALLDKEIQDEKKAKDLETARLVREVSELRIALKNRPGGSIGGDSGANVKVEDNVFSPEQLEALKLKAIRLKADPEKFIENAKKNLLARK